MKTIIKILVICLVIGCVFMLAGRAMGYKENKENRRITLNERTDAFKNISIDGVSLDVKIETADYYGYEIETYEDQRTSAKVENGTLTITQEKKDKNCILFCFYPERHNDTVKIFVPDSFECSSVNIKLVSGDTNINNIKCQDAKLTSVSGNIGLDKVLFDKLFSKTVSGGFTAEDLSTKSAEITTVSGDIKLDGRPEGETNLKTVSGGIMLNSVLKSDEYAKEATTVSGDIKVGDTSAKPYNDNPDKASNKLAAKTVSGDIKMQFAK